MCQILQKQKILRLEEKNPNFPGFLHISGKIFDSKQLLQWKSLIDSDAK
jgi:hypothetical protein